MELKQLIKDEDAVSPVIGVILMVAITVILAAVIGTFVLGLGDQVSNTTPQVSFSFNYEDTATDHNCNLLASGNEDGRLDITHDGGDKIPIGELSLQDDNGNSVSDYSTCYASGNAPSDVSAGSTAKAGVDSASVVRVIWTASGGGDSGTLGRWTGPDA